MTKHLLYLSTVLMLSGGLVSQGYAMTEAAANQAVTEALTSKDYSKLTPEVLQDASAESLSGAIATLKPRSRLGSVRPTFLKIDEALRAKTGAAAPGPAAHHKPLTGDLAARLAQAEKDRDDAHRAAKDLHSRLQDTETHIHDMVAKHAAEVASLHEDAGKAIDEANARADDAEGELQRARAEHEQDLDDLTNQLEAAEADRDTATAEAEANRQRAKTAEDAHGKLIQAVKGIKGTDEEKGQAVTALQGAL